MSQNYKDFSDFNSHIADYPAPSFMDSMSRLMSRLAAFKPMLKDLPGKWARSYAGVMVLKYASDGTPTDVTETVTGAGLTIPNSEIAGAKVRADEEMLAIQSLMSELNGIPVTESQSSVNMLLSIPNTPRVDAGYANIGRICWFGTGPDLVIQFNPGNSSIRLKQLANFVVPANIIANVHNLIPYAPDYRDFKMQGCYTFQSLAGNPVVPNYFNMTVTCNVSYAGLNPVISDILIGVSKSTDLQSWENHAYQLAGPVEYNGTATFSDVSIPEISAPSDMNDMSHSNLLLNETVSVSVSDIFQSQVDNCQDICDDLSQLMSNN